MSTLIARVALERRLDATSCSWVDRCQVDLVARSLCRRASLPRPPPGTLRRLPRRQALAPWGRSAGRYARAQLSASNSPSVSSMSAAARFSLRCWIDSVPGIGSIAGDRRSSHASAICAGDAP
jgi:hypothetical protein